jgi:hypothetical protein
MPGGCLAEQRSGKLPLFPVQPCGQDGPGEPSAQRKIEKRLERGRVDINVSLRLEDESNAPLEVTDGAALLARGEVLPSFTNAQQRR